MWLRYDLFCFKCHHSWISWDAHPIACPRCGLNPGPTPIQELILSRLEREVIREKESLTLKE